MKKRIDQQESSLSLKVLDGYVTDLGKGIARIDIDSMNALQLVDGDVVRIIAKHPAALKCFPRNLSERNNGNAQDVIMLNKQERIKMGLHVGGTVIVQKTS